MSVIGRPYSTDGIERALAFVRDALDGGARPPPPESLQLAPHLRPQPDGGIRLAPN